MATVPPTLSNTENFDASGDTLYVPKDSLAAYKSNAAWSAAFTNIVEQSGGQNPPVGPGGGAEDWGNGGEIEL